MEEKPCYNRKILRQIDLSGHPEVKGFDFNEPFNISNFLESFGTNGFQATNLHAAIHIIKAMRREQATIFMGCTSNMFSCGNRELIKYLVQHKLIHCLVTTAGGIEEDVIKTLEPFVIGSFDSPGQILFDAGVNRIGNIFVPNDRYTYFEKFMRPFLKKLQENGNQVTMLQFTKALGEAVNDESSVLYWAAKNNIPVHCPAPMDGALGDMIHFHRKNFPDFAINVAPDMDVIVKQALNSEKTGVIFLGGGVSKHYILNANIFREEGGKEGADFAVYITTATEFDGSDSGGNPQEAMTWGKIRTDAPNVKVVCEASIAFPLIMAGGFLDL